MNRAVSADGRVALYSQRAQRASGYLFAFIALLIWTGFIVSRLGGIGVVTAYDIAALRFGVGGLIVAPLFLWRGVGTLTLARLAWLAFFAGVGYALFVYSAFRFAPAAHGSVLLPGVLPFASAIAAYLLLGERPDARRKRSLLLIALGAGVLLAHIPFQPATNGPHRLTWLGEPLTLFVSAGVLLVTIGALIGAQPAAAR